MPTAAGPPVIPTGPATVIGPRVVALLAVSAAVSAALRCAAR
jgi:hypothetical protein